MVDRIEQLLHLLETDTEDPFLHYGLALEYGKRGQTAAALQHLDRTLSIDPQYWYAYFQKAQLLAADNRADEARLLLRQAMTDARRVGDSGARHAAEEMQNLLESFD